MTERDGLFLAHILAAIADIESFTAGGRGDFMADRKTQSAVVRQLAVVGEAVKNLSPHQRCVQTSGASSASARRRPAEAWPACSSRARRARERN